MKKRIIATLVAAVVLFIWQFLSWTALNVHGTEAQYTPNQDKIIQALSENLETGEYFIPGIAPGASAEEHQAAMENAIGKPWAKINYHSQMELNMGMNLTRGFIVDLLAAWLLVWLLMQFASVNISNATMASLAVGAIAYLTIPYLNSIWYESNTIGYVIDLVVQWGIIGVWLGWYLKK